MDSSDKIPKKDSINNDHNFLSDSQYSGSNSLTTSPVLEFLQKIDIFIRSDTVQKSKILFRGQKCSNWKVRTSAYIRIKREGKQEVSEEDELYYNLGLIEQFKHSDFNSKYSSEIMKGDLGILAELQHQGAATSLIDFSDNPLVALWFACQKSPESDSKNGEDGKNSKDGKVFILSTDDKSKFAEIDDLEQIKDYSSILSNEKSFYWKPAHLNKRITAQQSYFLIAKRISPEMKEISIEENLKSKIIEELSSVYGINEITLYPDLVGFAQANSIDSNYGKEKEWLRNRIIILYHDKIIKANPQYLQAYNKRGLAEHNLGEYKNALDNFTQVINIDPKNVDAYNNRGHSKYKLEDYKGTIDDYSEVINISPKNERAYYNRGDAKYKLKDYRGAIDDYNKSIEITPKNAKAYYHRGIAKRELQDYKGALNDLNKSIEMNSNNTKVYINRGYVKSVLKDDKGALDDLNKSIEIDPKNIFAYNNRGNVQGRLGHYQEAINDFSKAIEINPNYANAYINRSYAKIKFKKHKEALIDLNKAIEIEPNNANTYINRGNVKIESKDYNGAIDDYSKAIEIEPNNANTYINRGNVKRILNNYKEANDDYNKSIEIDPNNTYAYNNRGYTKYELQDYQSAMADFNKVLEINKSKSFIEDYEYAKNMLESCKLNLQNLKNKSSKNS